MTQRGESNSPVRGWEADSALTVLYAAHWQSLVRLSWLLVRDQQVAEATVLRHRTVGNRYLKAETSARTAFGTTTEPSAETRALEHATGDWLVSALGRLPRRQREVLTLRYYLDLSEAQIADALSISAGSVKAHAHRGLTGLRSDVEGAL